MFEAFQNIRVAEKLRAAQYDGLLRQVRQLWKDTRHLRSRRQQSVEFSGRVGDKPVNFRLDSIDSKQGGAFVLTVEQDEGLPGVSFMGGLVDWMIYHLPPKLEEAQVTGHRKNTGEQQIVTPKEDPTLFWEEIISLKEAGIEYMRQTVRDLPRQDRGVIGPF